MGLVASTFGVHLFFLSLVQIPRDILLQILGPSKVNNQAIKKIINIAVSEIVEKVREFVF